MNRTKKFFYNAITTALCQVCVMFAGFIIPRVMLRYYGSEINGLVSSISQFIVYFNLVEAGLSGAAIYALYRPLADNNHKAINGVISATQKYYTQAGYIFVSLTIGLAFVYPMFVRTDVLSPINVGLLVLILGVNGALEFFTLSKYRALLSADQRTYVISLASIVHIVANTLIIVVLVDLGTDIVVLRFIALFSIFLRSVILMAYVKVKYKYVNYKEKPDMAGLDKRWDVLYLQILGAIHSGAPVVILTVVLRDLKVISVYTIFYMVVSGLNGVLSIFKSGLSASFGNVIARGEQKTLQKAYSEFEFLYYSLITIIYSVAFVTIMPFIRIYTTGITDVNYDLPFIGSLFVLSGLLYNIKTPQGMIVISAGLYKETKRQTTIQGAIAILGGIILVPFWGLVGVMIAKILSDIYRNLDLLFFIPKHVTKLPVKKTLYRWVKLSICTATICVPFFFIEINPYGYLYWTLYASSIGIYAIFVVALSGYIFDRDDMKSVTKRIVSIVGVKDD